MVKNTYSFNDIAKNANIPNTLKNEFKVLTDKQSYYHITNISNNSNLSIPNNIPRTYLDKENNTILRVCVSDTIINCIIGKHGVCAVDDWTGIKCENSIYEINPDVILVPSTKVVPDAKCTNEKWLVNYDGKHNEHTFTKIGSIVSIVRYYTENKDLINNPKTRWKVKHVIALRLTKRACLYKDVYLDAGYYKVICGQDDDRTSESKKYYLPEITTKIVPNKTKKEIFNEYFGNEKYTIEKYNSYKSLKSEMVALSNRLPF